ncbi:MAG: hypothetical protein WDZ40_01425 [Candidatus Spechtbacterales bacterium]
MKKWIAILLVMLFLVVVTVFFVLRDRDSVNTRENSVFFSEEQIKDTDSVVEILASGEFSPKDLSVNKGDRVVWVNKSDKYVWPASDLHPTHAIYSEFDPLEPMAPNEAWGFVFERVDNWKYHDHLRPFSTGTIRVIE